MSGVLLTKGEDRTLTISIDIDGAPADISAATSVQVGFLDRRGVSAFPPVAASSATDGASWATGKIVVEIPSTSTANIAAGDYTVAISATVAGKVSIWRDSVVTVREGLP